MRSLGIPSLAVCALLAACSSSDSAPATGSGGSAQAGNPGAGGSMPVAGSTSSGGALGTGGAPLPPPGQGLADRLMTSDAVVPDGVKAGTRNFRIWASRSLVVAPVYTAALADCGTIVCYTSEPGGTPT